jgi:hypothetical protein
VQTRRVFVVATLAGVLVLTSVPRVQAMDPYSQDLLSTLLYGCYGPSPSDPYGNPTYGSSGYPPYYDPDGLGGGRCEGPARGACSPSPYDSYQGRENPYRYQERSGRLDRQYAKAMNRLERQEYEARAKAARKYYGDPVRYRDQMAKIDRKYAQKRDKVERNTAQASRKLSGRY